MSGQQVQAGKVVSLTYSVTDEAGEVVERVDLPVDYVHGRDSGLFEKIEQALQGKGPGDEVAVTLTPEEGFGAWDPTRTFTDIIENVPPQYREVGATAEFLNERGESINMVVTSMDNGTVTLDGNHPFAGKIVTFHVRVHGIRDASPEEWNSGQVAQAPNLLQ